MGFEVFLFWALTWLFLELSQARLQAYSLALLLAQVLALAALLASFDLDLLATLLWAVYSSVFVLLSLLALHLAPYSTLAVREQAQERRLSLWAALALLVPLTGVCGAPTLSPLWVSFYAWEADCSQGSVSLVHTLFYRCFTLETLWLNVFLLAALVAVVGLLVLLRFGPFGAGLQQALLATRHAASWHAPQNWRLRSVARFKRQTRRKNSGQLRFTGANRS